METWDIFKCECGRKYAINQVPGEELEEPACPECGGTNCELLAGESIN